MAFCHLDVGSSGGSIDNLVKIDSYVPVRFIPRDIETPLAQRRMLKRLALAATQLDATLLGAIIMSYKKGKRLSLNPHYPS